MIMTMTKRWMAAFDGLDIRSRRSVVACSAVLGGGPGCSSNYYYRRRTSRFSFSSSSVTITTSTRESETIMETLKAANHNNKASGSSTSLQDKVHVERSYFAAVALPSAAASYSSSSSSSPAKKMMASLPILFDMERLELTRLVDDLLWQTQQQMLKLLHPDHPFSQQQHHHIVAFSGGVDSSLAASLVYQSARQLQQQNSNSSNIIARAVLGTSAAVPAEQVLAAEQIANFIGIDFMTIPTNEGQDDVYIQNAGQACLACKTHLYATLQAVAQHATDTATAAIDTTTATGTGMTTCDVPRTSAIYYNDDVYNDATNDSSRSRTTSSSMEKTRRSVQLYNGTNADDLLDDTRLGLIAARHFDVCAPLQHINKATVRNVARHYFGLPNWNHAAQPCLRSRLALGVPATRRDLQRIERAERFVKTMLQQQKQQRVDPEQEAFPQFDETCNLRVRLFAGNRACIEVDEIHLPRVQSVDWNDTFLVQDLDFASISTRAFKSGSVATTTTTTINTKTATTTRGTAENNDNNNSSDGSDEEDESQDSTVSATL
jgi:pyridinium-3,5-biscarboxylic acid mononucleotide sulfurtransferase